MSVDTNSILYKIGQAVKELRNTGNTGVQSYTTEELPDTASNGTIAYDTTISAHVYFQEGRWLLLSDNSVVVDLVVDPSLWTPDANTAVVWFDADDLSTITKDSTTNLVSQWNDKSSNNNHATQSDSALQPADAPSGDGIEFDGSNDALVLSNEIDEGDMSIFVVMKGDGHIFANNQDSRIVIADFQLDDIVDLHHFFWQIDGKRAVKNKDITGHDASKVQILEFNRSGQVISVRVNSVSGYSANSEDSIASSRIKIDRIGMKWDATTGVGAWDGNIYEIIAVTSTGDRAKIEGYLAHKWGLEADLPANHPYKETAPEIS